MALIKRGDKQYLIRSIRRNGKVTSQYLASGERAIELDRAFRALAPSRPGPEDARELRQARREAERAARRAKDAAAEARKRDEALEVKVSQAHSEAKSIASEAMRAAGFHQHRWIWRKKRKTRGVAMNGAQGVIDKPAASEEQPAVGLSPAETRSKLEAEFARAIETAPARLIALLDEHDGDRAEGEPSLMVNLARAIGADPVDAVAEQLIGEWSSVEFHRELLRRQVAQMKAELVGTNPTAAERHLVDRTMICWLDVHVSERRAIRLESSLAFTPAEKSQFQKTRDRANRRYLECLKSLDLVRKRALPSLRMTLAVQDGASGSSAAAMVEAGGSAEHSKGLQADVRRAIENPHGPV